MSNSSNTYVNISWSVLSQLSVNIIQLITTMVLARIFAPELFGLVAMSATLITFLSFFSDMGLSLALIAKDELNNVQKSNVFWLSGALGLMLFIISFYLAPAVADFYNSPLVKDIVRVQAISFIFIGANLQPIALLKRNQNFAEVAKIDMVSAFLANAAGLALAFSGLGVWSIVVIPVLTHALRFPVYLKTQWGKLQRPQDIKNSLDILKFGGALGAASILLYFARNLDDVLIGRFLGASPLAFYSKAYFLVGAFTVLLNSAISPVAISAMSKLRREGGSKDETLLLEKLRLMAFFVFPIATGVAAIAPDVILVVLGPQWLSSIFPLRVLALSGIGFTLMAAVGWSLVAHNKVRDYFKWTALTTLILCLGFWHFSQQHINAVSMFYSFAYGLILPLPCFTWAMKKCGYKTVDKLVSLIPILFSALFMGGFVYYCQYYVVTGLPLIVRLGINIPLGVFLYAVLAIKLVRPLPIPPLQRWLDRLSRRKDFED